MTDLQQQIRQAAFKVDPSLVHSPWREKLEAVADAAASAAIREVIDELHRAGEPQAVHVVQELLLHLGQGAASREHKEEEDQSRSANPSGTSDADPRGEEGAWIARVDAERALEAALEAGACDTGDYDCTNDQTKWRECHVANLVAEARGLLKLSRDGSQ